MAVCDLLGPIGAFGKMPSQGDFFWADLPAGFAAAWDPWLSGVMRHARQQLGERWQECYYSAPIWRFTLPPGQAGRFALAGVLMPSVDRVGRDFPLTLVAPIGANDARPLGHLRHASMFEAMETIALGALEFTETQQSLRQKLVELRQNVILLPDSPPQAVPEVFANAQGSGFWSALVDGRMEFMTTPQLPTARDLIAMIDLSDPYWRPEAAE